MQPTEYFPSRPDWRTDTVGSCPQARLANPYDHHSAPEALFHVMNYIYQPIPLRSPDEMPKGRPLKYDSSVAIATHDYKHAPFNVKYDYQVFWKLFSNNIKKLTQSNFPVVARWIDANRSFVFRGQSLEDYFKRDRKLEKLFLVLENTVITGPTELKEKYISEKGLDALMVMRLQRVLEDNRRLMASGGGFVGWVDRRARIGDEIWLLKGCSVPVVLRQRDGGRGG
jgi:hypothetical protein